MPTPTPKKPRRGGPGGRPVYTPETAQRRAQGRVNLALAPEDAATLRKLGAERPGGMASLVTSWIRSALDPDEGRLIHEGLVRLLREGPVLLTLDRGDHGDVVLRLLRVPVPPCGVAAEGAGPGLHEALLGLRCRSTGQRYAALVEALAGGEELPPGPLAVPEE